MLAEHAEVVSRLVLLLLSWALLFWLDGPIVLGSLFACFLVWALCKMFMWPDLFIIGHAKGGPTISSLRSLAVICSPLRSHL